MVRKFDASVWKGGCKFIPRTGDGNEFDTVFCSVFANLFKCVYAEGGCMKHAFRLRINFKNLN